MSTAAEVPASPFFDPDFQKDPYPELKRLREEDPVHWVPGLDFWFVTRFDDVKRLLNDPENCTNDRRAWEKNTPPPEGTFMRWVSENGLFALGPKEHARIRKLVSGAFTPRAIRRQEAQVREVIDRFAKPLHGRTGVVDLMAEYTDPIPNAVISRITGIPPGDDEVRFRELAQWTIRGFFTFGDEGAQKKGEQAFLELAEWVRRMTAERRSDPGEDLITDLVQVQEHDDRLSDDEIIILITSLIGAGSETTAISGMLAVQILLDHPEALARIRADRSLVPNAVQEILRYGFGGAGGLPRYAVRDFELRGKKIRKGQLILLGFGGANRDPAVYEDPDRFDIGRDIKELVIFGNGPHYCLGVHLAHAETRGMVDALLDFLPEGARYREDLAAYQQSGLFRRLTNLPVDFGGGSPA